MSSSFRLVYWIGLWSYWAYALSPPSTSVSSDFMVLCECLKNSNYFTLPCRGLNWPGGIGHLPGGQTNYCPSVLDTVGWVMWPVKFVPDMTYNVFGGTLNPTLPTYLPTLANTTHGWTQQIAASVCTLACQFVYSRSAWVECSASYVCLSVCFSTATKTNNNNNNNNNQQWSLQLKADQLHVLTSKNNG